VVTIDGPAGAGKSTVARRLARELSWRYLDTGALYRAVALVALERQMGTEDGAALGALAAGLVIQQDAAGRTVANGRDVTDDIRTEEVSAAASTVSAHPAVRAALVDVQRRVANDGPLVCEGRDMGTVIFPNATLKLFLDASQHTRAQRRADELRARGEDADVAVLERSIAERDHRDATRSAAPLRRDKEQVLVDTTELSIAQVLEQLRTLVAERCGGGAVPGT